MEHAAVFRLIAGLGNPGRQYAGTRHNAGFFVLDELARRASAAFQFDAKWNADVATCGGRTLMKPQTFMNLSGEAVGGYLRYHRLDPAEVERALRELPGIDDAFVDTHAERSDTLVAAVVAQHAPLTWRELLRERIASWKIPRRLVVLPEFPLTARGKTDLRRLRERLRR